MKLGAKIFLKRDIDFLEKVIDQIDFIETIAIHSQDYSFLKKYGKKIVIHAEHQSFGPNPADSMKSKRNLESITFALELADELKASKVICHPGIISNKNCNEKTAINFFKKINDERILIENLPLLDYRGRAIDALCSLPEPTAAFLEKSSKKLCFDISHAIISALAKNRADYNEFLTPYLALNPSHFHFSDILLNKKRDHLHFGEGNLDTDYYRKLFQNNAEVTLETRNNAAKLLDDIKILNPREISNRLYIQEILPDSS